MPKRGTCKPGSRLLRRIPLGGEHELSHRPVLVGGTYTPGVIRPCSLNLLSLNTYRQHL